MVSGTIAHQDAAEALGQTRLVESAHSASRLQGTRRWLNKDSGANGLFALVLAVMAVPAIVVGSVVDVGMYVALTGWYLAIAWNLRPAADNGRSWMWLRGSMWTSGSLAVLAALVVPANVADRDVACLVACGVLIVLGTLVALRGYLLTR